MPIHDWSNRPSGLFHHFHQRWSAAICDALNDGRLPEDYEALIEQKLSKPEPDILAVHSGPKRTRPDDASVATLVRPQTRFTAKSPADVYAEKANRVVVRHQLGEVVAVIEIVSRGNKAARAALKDFVSKAVQFIRNGVNLMVIDLYEPSIRDPQGIHAAIWQAFSDEPFELPSDKRLTQVSYRAAEPKEAFIEPVAVGDTLFKLGLYIDPWECVEVPLEDTYMEAWRVSGPKFRKAIETGELTFPEEAN